MPDNIIISHGVHSEVVENTYKTFVWILSSSSSDDF